MINTKKFCISRELDYKQFLKRGIYKIYFTNLDKVYIGSTTISFKSRLSRHINALQKNCHHSIKLQYAYNKYGENNFNIEIIEVLDNFTKNEILAREQYWMNYYKAYKNGYNSVKNANNSLGFKMYDSVVEKRRLKFLQYNLDGNFIREWNSYTQITKEVCSFCNYNKVLNSNNFSSGGFMWRRKTVNYPLKIESYVHTTKQEIYQYSLDGIFIKKWESLLAISKELNIPVGNISHYLNGSDKICYGFYFSKFPKEFNVYERIHPFQKRIRVTNLITGKILEFSGKREMTRIMNINRSGLRSALEKNNGIMTHKKLKIEEI